MLKLFKWTRTPPQPIVETVPKSQYDTLVAGHDALGFDYALVVGLAKRALALLLEVDTTRSGGIALFRKRSDLLKEAGAAGLLEEKKEE